MATRGPKIKKDGGYDCEFVWFPLPNFQTERSVCLLLVLRDAHLAISCGLNFCKECIRRLQKAAKSCPICNTESSAVTHNRAYDVALKQLEIYCTCTPHMIGCEWKGKLEILDKRLNVDPQLNKQLEGYAYVEVQCYHDSCGQSFQRRLIAIHQSSEYLQRPFSCEYCHSHKSTYRDVTTHHWPVCECYPVSCPHNCAQNTLQRQNLQKHLNLNEACPFQTVEYETNDRKLEQAKEDVTMEDFREFLDNCERVMRDKDCVALTAMHGILYCLPRAANSPSILAAEESVQVSIQEMRQWASEATVTIEGSDATVSTSKAIWISRLVKCLEEEAVLFLNGLPQVANAKPTVASMPLATTVHEPAQKSPQLPDPYVFLWAKRPPVPSNNSLSPDTLKECLRKRNLKELKHDGLHNEVRHQHEEKLRGSLDGVGATVLQGIVVYVLEHGEEYRSFY